MNLVFDLFIVFFNPLKTLKSWPSVSIKPAYLTEIAKTVAKYRNQSYDHICDITYKNYTN